MVIFACYGVYTMSDQLTRVQVYLDPNDVAQVDRLAKKLKIKRSQIIRDATKAVALRYARSYEMLESKQPKKNPLLSLIGFANSKTGTVGLDIDEIYEKD